MTNYIKGIARRSVTVETDMSPEDFISFMDDLSARHLFIGLDSLDMGDAMGAVIALLQESAFDGSMDIDTPQGYIKAWEDAELFEWEGLD